MKAEVFARRTLEQLQSARRGYIVDSGAKERLTVEFERLYGRLQAVQGAQVPQSPAEWFSVLMYGDFETMQTMVAEHFDEAPLQRALTQWKQLSHEP